MRKVNFGFPRGGGVIFSLDEDVTLKFGYNDFKEPASRDEIPDIYSIITKTNILTGEQKITRVKEMGIWGLDTLVPIAITNVAAQGR